MTSRDLVNIIQGRLQGRRAKVGHCGTLDPLAEGVLVVGVGPAVKLVPMVQDQPKHYRGTFRLGQSSPTGDLELEPTVFPDLPRPTLDQLQHASRSMHGEIEQIPPAYSAVKIDGRRAYDRVRAGQQVEMPTRRVRIDRLEIVRFDFPDLELDIVCGSGTYIRSLGIDLAAAVGTKAVMTSLRRTGVGTFTWDDSVTVDQIRERPLEDFLRPARQGVNHLPTLVVSDLDSTRLGHGLCVCGEPSRGKAFGDSNHDAPYHDNSCEIVAALTPSGALRALLKRKNGQWCPYRVFPTA